MKKYLSLLVLVFMLVSSVAQAQVLPTGQTSTLTAQRCVSTSAPSLRLIAPNGGEVFVAGDYLKIKWETCNIPATAQISLILQDDVRNPRNATGWGVTNNDGYQEFRTPVVGDLFWNTSSFGKNFKIYAFYKLTASQASWSTGDSSDALFTINRSSSSVITPTATTSTYTATPTFPSTSTLPAGCTSTSGYSTYNGQPCSGSSTLPAGCTSTYGYSTYNGQPCGGGSTLPAGCASTSGYSSTTGQPCSGSSTLPAGCSSTYGYSLTTGQSCSGGSTTTCAVSADIKYPFGGEVYNVGDTILIRWSASSSCTTGRIRLNLLDNRYSSQLGSSEGLIRILPAVNGQNNSYSFTIPASLGTLSNGTIGGNNAYSIRIDTFDALGNAQPIDQSAVFSIRR